MRRAVKSGRAFLKPYADLVARVRVPMGFVLVAAFAWFARPTSHSLVWSVPVSFAGLALRAWAEQNNLHSIIVPTEIFSTRRVRWMLHRVFPPDFVIRIAALDPSVYSRSDWWRGNNGRSALEIEFLKYLYYIVRY